MSGVTHSFSLYANWGGTLHLIWWKINGCAFLLLFDSRDTNPPVTHWSIKGLSSIHPSVHPPITLNQRAVSSPFIHFRRRPGGCETLCERWCGPNKPSLVLGWFTYNRCKQTLQWTKWKVFGPSIPEDVLKSQMFRLPPPPMARSVQESLLLWNKSL